MRKRAVATAAIVAAVAVFWVLTWPAPPALSMGTPDPGLLSRTMAGAFHVHSTRSDGAAGKAEIAAAAARAGLTFVVFADHGDGTRQPDSPEYVSGVLCIEAVEISTNGGHYVALGMPASPYRLGGEAAAVVDDVRRLGGFGVVAHPDSPRQELAWRDWTLDVDGVEWLNADTEWRNKSTLALAGALLAYLPRSAPALARLLDRPALTLSRWDGATMRRHMAAFAGHDAHGGLGAGSEARGRFRLPGVPSYEASFRSFALRAVLSAPPTGDARQDAALLVDALRQGRTFTAVDGAAAPAWLEFTGQRQGHRALMGESVQGSGPVTVEARGPVVPGSVMVLTHGGNAIAESSGGALSASVQAPGSYRVEVRLAGAANRAPWILSNPIYVDLPPPVVPPSPAPGADMFVVSNEAWRVEKEPASEGVIETRSGRLRWRFRLRSGAAVSQFVAVASDLPETRAAFDAIVVDATAAAPCRVSVQLRSLDGSARWGRSVYLSQRAAPVVIRVADLLPMAPTQGQSDPRAARSILLVVDLVNASPGAAGEVEIGRVALTQTR